MAIEDYGRETRQAAASNEAYARGLFDFVASVAVGRDFSEVKAMLDDAMGRALPTFGRSSMHPEFVQSCMERIRVVDVNRQTPTCLARVAEGCRWRGSRNLSRRDGAFVRRAVTRLLARQPFSSHGKRSIIIAR